MGPGFGVGCGLAFCVAFGFGRSAVVSFVLVIGSRAVLVLAVPPGGGFVCSCFWFACGVGFGRPAWRWFRLSLFLVLVCRLGFCFGRVRWFRFIFSQ